MKNSWKAAVLIMAAAFVSSPSPASVVLNGASPPRSESQPDHSPGAAEMVRAASVGLLVEIPGSKLLFRHHLSLPEGSTVSQALESVYAVKHAVVCCDSRDIWSVNGLAADPYKEKWWIIKVNGNTQNTSSTRKLSDGDVVELVYMENALHPVAHVRLEDWANARK